MKEFISKVILAFRVQFSSVAATYNFLVLISLILYLIVGESYKFFAFFSNMAHIIFACCFIALALSFFAPKDYRWLWCSFAAPSLIIFVVVFGSNFINYLSPSPSRKADLSVMTYNINGEQNIAKIIQTLQQNPVDIVAIQEISTVLSKSMDDLSGIYPYHHFIHIQWSGLAILSRYPIVEESIIEFGNFPEFRHLIGLRLLIDYPDQPVAVYSIHLVRPTSTLLFLDYDSSQRSAATDLVLEMVANEEHPIILGCDCNFSQTTDDYRKLNTYLTDTWQRVGRGLGLTARTGTPLIRSDYIWVSNDFTPLSASVIKSDASDHMPVIAGLIFNDTEN